MTSPSKPLPVATFHHVGIVVPAMEPATSRFVSLFDAQVTRSGSDDKLGANWCWLTVGTGVVLELLSPMTPDTGIIAAYLRRRGPGLHHLSLLASDLDQCLAWAHAGDIPVLGLDRHHAGFEEFFLRPDVFSGVLCHVFRELSD